MIGGLAVFTVANLLSALSPTLAFLLATRVIAALAAGLVAPASYALASTLGSSHNRGKILAIIAAGFTSAIVLEPVREHVESSESFVIQGKRPDSIWGVADVDEQESRTL